MSNIEVYLLSAAGDTIATTLTDNDGNYTFDNVPPGDYTIEVGEGPDGSSITTPASYDVTIVDGEDIENVFFGYEPAPNTGTVVSVVFSDDNGNGVQDPTETGIAGVTVILIDSEGNEISTITNSDGEYSFNNIVPGDYEVVVGEGPAGSTLTTPASYDITIVDGDVLDLSLIHI